MPRANVGRDVVDEQVGEDGGSEDEEDALEETPRWDAGGRPGLLAQSAVPGRMFVIVILLPEFVVAEEEAAHVPPPRHSRRDAF